jgi:DNA repair protein RecO (recombination protein O)
VIRVQTRALVARAVPFGEADAIVTLLTQDCGKVAAVARGARKANRRFQGTMDPFHRLDVAFEDRGAELVTLKEANLSRVRANITASLDAVDGAGMLLRWARHVFLPRSPEPESFDLVDETLDAFDELAVADQTSETRSCHIQQHLARAGILLLAWHGYGLEFGACVQCGKACPAGKAARFSAHRGGIVCTECGHATGIVLDGAARQAAAAWSEGQPATGPGLPLGSAKSLVVAILESFAVHTEFEP